MYLSYIDLTLQTILLGIEAQSVIGLRLRKIAEGGPAAMTEALGMVTEKVAAMTEANATFASGGSVHSVVQRFRTYVQANETRLLAA